MIKLEKIAGALYLSSALFLALFCLYQSHRMGHDQSAREIAGRAQKISSSNQEISVPYPSPKRVVNLKKLGEGTD